jgi:hypothetical protein
MYRRNALVDQIFNHSPRPAESHGYETTRSSSAPRPGPSCALPPSAIRPSPPAAAGFYLCAPPFKEADVKRAVRGRRSKNCASGRDGHRARAVRSFPHKGGNLFLATILSEAACGDTSTPRRSHLVQAAHPVPFVGQYQGSHRRSYHLQWNRR